jgi:Ca-activated chloride channel family protein
MAAFRGCNVMDDSLIANFHFLRPLWLLAVPWTLWTHWRLRRRYLAALQWQAAIAPHLLAHLTVAGQRGLRIRPYQILTLVSLLGVLGAAGPAWERQITPFTEDRAPLVVALELNTSMLAADTQPTRLERAKQKLRDVMARRQGARTAVIVYSGSAHTVLPLTDDVDLVETYLESLLPSVMPLPGDNPAAVLAVADAMLVNEPAAGSILFLTDGIDASLAPVFEAHRQQSTDQVLILALGTEEGGPVARDADPQADTVDAEPGIDLHGLARVASAAGNDLVRVTVDASDIDRIMSGVRSHLVNAIADDENLSWRDAGYLLVWPMALLALMFFRRGWTVQWV